MSDTKAAAGYYITRSGMVSGPFTKIQLKQMADSGMVRPEDLVSRDGTEAVAASRVKGLLQRDVSPRPSPESKTPPPLPEAEALSLEAEPESSQGVWEQAKLRWQRLSKKQKIAVGCGAAFLGLMFLSAVSRNGAGSPGGSAAAAREAIRVDAMQLYQDYHDNEVSANAKYHDKPVEVTGVIDSVKTEYIRLEASKQFAIGFVHVYLNSADQAKMGSLRTGQLITVRGTCDGKSFLAVEVKDANLVGR